MRVYLSHNLIDISDTFLRKNSLQCIYVYAEEMSYEEIFLKLSQFPNFCIFVPCKIKVLLINPANVTMVASYIKNLTDQLKKFCSL